MFWIKHPILNDLRIYICCTYQEGISQRFAQVDILQEQWTSFVIQNYNLQIHAHEMS